MKDIETIKEQAKKGNVLSQVELAHAYLNGEGTIKNRGLYLKWLENAARQGHLESRLELVEFYSQKRNKYANPNMALYWMYEAQKLGATFTDEQLLAIGDPTICTQEIEELLFGEGKTHNFAKAKELILRISLPQEKLSEYAKRYYDIYHNDGKMLSNISYLLKLSFNRDHDKLNEYAVELAKSKAKNSMKIAFSLFSEAYSLGNPYAASSYLYCLLNGKGCRRDINRGASIYFNCKRKNIDVSRAFASHTHQGIVAKLPNCFAWKINCFKHNFAGVLEKIENTFGSVFSSVWGLFVALWTIVKKIGIVSLILSSSVLFCILKLNFSWIITTRQFIESIIPVSWGGYIILFVILTAIFSIPILLYENWKSKQPNEYFRKQWNEFGLSLPPFIVVNMRTVERTDGCYGSSTHTTVYTIRFIEKVPYWTFQQKGEWVNPNYQLETYTFSIKQLTEDTAEVTIGWIYTP